jgi:predicted DCC family thiol-disulfide oxidoreductase YuxK
MNALFSDVSSANGTRRRGWVFYDADCAFCTSLARWLEPTLLRRGFHFAALQEPWVAIVLGLSREELLRELRARAASGEVLGGADALLHLARHIWWACPLYALARIPSPRDIFRAAYRWFAARRHCPSAIREATAQRFPVGLR